MIEFVLFALPIVVQSSDDIRCALVDDRLDRPKPSPRMVGSVSEWKFPFVLSHPPCVARVLAERCSYDDGCLMWHIISFVFRRISFELCPTTPTIRFECSKTSIPFPLTFSLETCVVGL